MTNVASNMPEQAQEEAKPKKGLARWLPLFIIAGALGAFFALGLNKYFDLNVLRENRASLLEWTAREPILAIGVFIAAYAAAVAISFPGASILTIFGGFLFGLWPGVPMIVTAATLGAFIIFVAAKTAFGDALSQKAGGFAKRMEEGFRSNELSYMLLLRLVPLFPFWAVNIGAGVAGVKARNYLIGTFIGIIPGSFVYAGIGATAGDAFDAGEELTLSGVLLAPQTIALLSVFTILAIAPMIYRWRAGKAKDAQ